MRRRAELPGSGEEERVVEVGQGLHEAACPH